MPKESTTRKRVVVAEDDPLSRRLLEASLSNWGYEVLLAEDGQQARELLKAGGVDICILDWEMPKLNGIEVCKWLRSSQLIPKPYVILLTANNGIGAAGAGYSA